MLLILTEACKYFYLYKIVNKPDNILWHIVVYGQHILVNHIKSYHIVDFSKFVKISDTEIWMRLFMATRLTITTCNFEY